MDREWYGVNFRLGSVYRPLTRLGCSPRVSPRLHEKVDLGKRESRKGGLRAAGVSRETVLGFADEMRAVPPGRTERALGSWISLSFEYFRKQYHNYVYEMVYFWAQERLLSEL